LTTTRIGLTPQESAVVRSLLGDNVIELPAPKLGLLLAERLVAPLALWQARRHLCS
jgi:hypothetical protein